MDMTPPRFVISLSIDQFAAFCARNASARTTFEHFRAVDGRKLESLPPGILADGVRYTPGNIGLAISHRALWDICIARDEVVAVFEDDAVLRHDFNAQVAALLVQRARPDARGWDLLLLGCNMDTAIELGCTPGIDIGVVFSAMYPKPDHIDAFVRSNDPINLLPLRLAFGTCGYLITPAGAAHLKQHCFPMDNRRIIQHVERREVNACGIDCMMISAYATMAAALCLPPLVMTPNDKSSSQTM
jgi:glycosyl transferase family 25